MTTKYRMRPDDGDSRHGTINGYSNLRCRCLPCRAAWADYSFDMRNSAVLPPDDPRHGTTSSYINYACRCSACREAMRVAWRRRRDLERNVSS